MGYKLTGCDVIGNCEIDKKMNEVYVANHNPKYNYNCDIRVLLDLAKKGELPKELYSLDILDGSPPCSSFSVSGNREKDWGKEKKFKEGQKSQVLDALFFEFLDLAKYLKPKCIIAENVKGILIRDAIKYTQKILADMKEMGYITGYYVLNSRNMGVPQSRTRVFFIGILKDFTEGQGLFGDELELDLIFTGKDICFKHIDDGITGNERKKEGKIYSVWKSIESGCYDQINKNKYFNHYKISPEMIVPTIIGNFGSHFMHYTEYRDITKEECRKASTFPKSFNFLGVCYGYVCGMSVPPYMMRGVAEGVIGLLNKYRNKG